MAWIKGLAATAVAVVLAGGASAQQAPRNPAWFGVPAPGPVSDLDRPTFAQGDVVVGPTPVAFKKPADPSGALGGARMMANMRAVTNFARESRANGELLWGRIAGMPAQKKTVEWGVAQLKSYGIANAHSEEFTYERGLWLPRSFEVKLNGDPSFGAGTGDIVLRSAMPISQARSLAAALTAPLVFVGRGSPAELANIDVRGKIAVVNVKPDVALVASRERGVAREVVLRGAVGVINAVESPGNFQYFDGRYGCGEAPCFLVGGDDGAFLEAVIARAAAAGKPASLKATLSLQSEVRTGTKAYNGVGIIAGKSDEVIIVNAHTDSWFDGANDNADGVAVALGLAEHYAKGPKPDRTLVFVLSAGHHTANGPADFIAKHPEIIEKTVMVINLEHVAQIAVTQAPRLDPGTSGYGSGTWNGSTAEMTKRAGAVNTTPFVKQLMARAASQYGVVTTYGVSDQVPGDLGAYVRTGKPSMQIIASEVFYHSSGDNPSTISQPGLERAAFFFRDFINAVGKARKDQLMAPAGARPAAAGGEG